MPGPETKLTLTRRQVLVLAGIAGASAILTAAPAPIRTSEAIKDITGIDPVRTVLEGILEWLNRGKTATTPVPTTPPPIHTVEVTATDTPRPLVTQTPKATETAKPTPTTLPKDKPTPTATATSTKKSISSPTPEGTATASGPVSKDTQKQPDVVKGNSVYDPINPAKDAPYTILPGQRRFFKVKEPNLKSVTTLKVDPKYLAYIKNHIYAPEKFNAVNTGDIGPNEHTGVCDGAPKYGDPGILKHTGGFGKADYNVLAVENHASVPIIVFVSYENQPAPCVMPNGTLNLGGAYIESIGTQPEGQNVNWATCGGEQDANGGRVSRLMKKLDEIINKAINDRIKITFSDIDIG